MHVPNYKVGWLTPQKVAALTHFHPNVTQMDVMGVFMEFHGLVQGATVEFQLIIDNRVVSMDRIFTLAELQSASPLLSHPLLKTITVIKPQHLSLNGAQRQLETQGHVSLRNVDSLEDAFAFLRREGVDLEGSDPDFFPNSENS